MAVSPETAMLCLITLHFPVTREAKLRLESRYQDSGVTLVGYSQRQAVTELHS